LHTLALFTATATAIGGGNGHTETSDGAIRADLGKPGLATPEHLFAAGYAACFGGSLDFVAKQRKRDATKAKITCAVTIGQREAAALAPPEERRVVESGRIAMSIRNLLNHTNPGPISRNISRIFVPGFQ
jgi:osmotically inducible protein OsmC